MKSARCCLRGLLATSMLRSQIFSAVLVAIAPSLGQAQVSCEPPDLVILLDKSGSMGSAGGQDADGNPISKWRIANGAIGFVTQEFEASLRFGLILFATAGNCCVNDVQVPLQIQANQVIGDALANYSPGGFTPIHKGLEYAAEYYRGHIAADPEPFRRRFVVLVTDGQANCGSSQCESTCADCSVSAGEAPTESVLENAVLSLRGLDVGSAAHDVQTFVIGFGTGVDPAQLTRIADLGGERPYYQADDEDGLRQALTDIANNATQELCNGLDDDCDGVIDEDLTKPCTSACGRGERVCENGQWLECTARQPAEEECDGEDNDCDGVIDEDLHRDCSTACGPGTEFCVEGSWVNCTAPLPEEEVCDGEDNDCDKEVDEGNPGAGESCFADETEVCLSGFTTCKDGEIICLTARAGRSEVCDGYDNDCDGVVDEDCGCILGDKQSCGSDEGACMPGRRLCDLEGNWSGCLGAVEPAKEVCDCLDNDCNGVVDDKDAALCDNGAPCVDCRCASTCPSAGCTPPLVCEDGHCVPPGCHNATDCPDGSVCHDGTCYPPCEIMVCPEHHACYQGRCLSVNCAQTGCESGEICIGKHCHADPCHAVVCENAQFCRDGACVDSCVGVTCDPGERCTDGICVADPCALCTPEETCAGEQCVPKDEDPCQLVLCPPGTACDAGACAVDPCTTVTCPGAQACRNGQCVLESSVPADPGLADPSPPTALPPGGDPPTPAPGLPDEADQARVSQAVPLGCSGASDSTGAPLGAGLWLLGFLAALVVRHRSRRLGPISGSGSTARA